MPDRSPVVRRLELGKELRDVRERAGLDIKDIAKELRWDVSKVSRLENGTRTISALELDRVMERCGVSGERAARIDALAQGARKRGNYGRVQDWARSYVGLEEAAAELLIHYGALVPGILQTEAYARSLLEQFFTVRVEDVDEIAKNRVRRRERLNAAEPPELSVVLGEPAVLGVVGDGGVMREQLQLLLDTARLKHVTLQVLPLSNWAHPALGSSFTMLRLDDPEKTLVYLEDMTNADYLAGSHHVETYSLAFNRLRVTALNEHDSAALIREALENFP